MKAKIKSTCSAATSLLARERFSLCQLNYNHISFAERGGHRTD